MFTKMMLCQKFFWKRKTAYIEVYIRAYIHCLSDAGTEEECPDCSVILPRTHQRLASCSSPRSKCDPVLTVIGIFSCYETIDATMNGAWRFRMVLAISLTEPSSTGHLHFTVNNGLMSEVSTRFRNERGQSVSNNIQLLHYFTCPYWSWIDGGIEALGEDAPQTF